MKETTKEHRFNRWMAAALMTWGVMTVAIVALVMFAGDRIWFNITSNQDVTQLMEDKAEYINAYSFADSPKE